MQRRLQAHRDPANAGGERSRESHVQRPPDTGERRRNPPPPASIKLTTTVASGAFAGAVSALASHPADTVLTRLNMAEGNTLLGVIRSLGWKGMWYGAGTLAFGLPHAARAFLCRGRR